MNICKKIREIRGNESQSSFAERFGITIRTLQNYEYGNTSPSIDFIQKISQEYDITPEYFFDYEKKFPNSSPIVPQYSSPMQKKSSSISKNTENMSPSNKKESQILNDSYYSIPKLNLSAQAGGGNEILDLQCYESGEVLMIDKAFFKAIPSKNLKAIRVEGYSMMPMLTPDSWVVFEDSRHYKGDGLYIINYGGQLMVKLLQLNPINNVLDIISVNKDYKSYSIPLEDSQVELIIAGKVLRCII